MEKVYEAIEDVLAFVRSIPLGKSSIKQYRIYLLNHIVPYCEANDIVDFTDDKMQVYAGEQMSRWENGEFSKSTMMHRRKAAALLADCMQGRKLVWEHKSFKQQIPCKRFAKVLDDYCIQISQSLAPKTVRRHICIIRQLFVFMEKRAYRVSIS